MFSQREFPECNVVRMVSGNPDLKVKVTDLSGGVESLEYGQPLTVVFGYGRVVKK